MIEYYSTMRRKVEIRYKGHIPYLKRAIHMMHVAVVYTVCKDHFIIISIGMNSPEHHAEVLALKAAAKRSIKYPSDIPLTLLVWRVSNSGHILNSKPCGNCVKTLARASKNLKIKSIIYSELFVTKIYFIKTNVTYLVEDPNKHSSYKMRKTLA
jgi:hypothetical protein